MTTEITINLSSPIQIDGIAKSALSIREPTVEDMLTIKKQAQTPEDQELTLFSNLCQVAPTTLRSLKWRDYRKLQKAFSKMTDDESPLELSAGNS